MSASDPTCKLNESESETLTVPFAIVNVPSVFFVTVATVSVPMLLAVASSFFISARTSSDDFAFSNAVCVDACVKTFASAPTLDASNVSVPVAFVTLYCPPKPSSIFPFTAAASLLPILVASSPSSRVIS